jgi:hypothetical protein
MHEEGEHATARRGDDLAAIGIDDCERPVLGDGFGEDRSETLLVGGDEGGALGMLHWARRSCPRPGRL